MSGRLEGRVAWVSGGASGIGEATARLFAAEGARVAIADVQTERGRCVEASIREAGGDATFFACDVARESAVQACLEQTVVRYGGLHILVNGAGVVHVKRLHEYDEHDWDRLMAVNVKSIFFAVKHGLKYLRKHPSSTIVNIGSISSFVGQASTPAYTASKAAVLLLSQSIALDYAADGVRCNCVCPGITDTPLLRHHLHEAADPVAALSQRLHRVPIGRALTPADIARAVLYLASDDSAGVTGTSLTVDGGYLAAAEWETEKVSLPADLL